MIKTKSSHYKIIPWRAPGFGTLATSYILSIYVWNGVKSSVPINPKYQIENFNPLAREGNSEVNISNHINDFIVTELITNTTTSLNNANSSVWVYTEVAWYVNGAIQSIQALSSDLAVKGYGYGNEGINPTTPTNGYLATQIEQKVSRNGVYLFSFLASETIPTTIKLNNTTFTVPATTNSTELVQTCYVKVSEFTTDFIEIYKDNTLITSLLITDEPKHEPLDIVFVNKEGQLQSITFFKEITGKLNVSKESYESSNGQPINGVHQFKEYNVNARESFSMNSGFVKEDNNEIFTQLLLSDRVWNLKNNVYIPLNLGTETIEYKTRNKDRLINYNIEFKYSFNKINTI